MPAGTKTKKRNNAEQERFYVFQHRKTRKHHGVVRFWRHLYKGHAHTHTHTKKKNLPARANNNRQQSLLSRPHATTRETLSENFRNVFCTLFFFPRRALPEIAENSATTVHLPTRVVWRSHPPCRGGEGTPVIRRFMYNLCHPSPGGWATGRVSSLRSLLGGKSTRRLRRARDAVVCCHGTDLPPDVLWQVADVQASIYDSQQAQCLQSWCKVEDVQI